MYINERVTKLYQLNVVSEWVIKFKGLSRTADI